MKATKAMESMRGMGVDPLSVRVQRLAVSGVVVAACIRHGQIVMASGATEGQAYKRLASAVFLSVFGDSRQRGAA